MSVSGSKSRERVYAGIRPPLRARVSRHQSTFIRIRVLRNGSLAFVWLAKSVPITADYGTRNGNVGPGCFSQPAAGAVFFRCIVQPGPQPCLEALPSRYLEWASFRSLIERSSMAAIPMPRSSLLGRLAEALGCRSAALRSKIARGLLLQQQSQRSCYAPHRSGVAAEFSGYPRCANSLPGKPD